MPSSRVPEPRTTSPTKPTRSRKIDLRLSEAERAALEVRAGKQPLGVYIRARLFAVNDNTPPRRSRRLSRDDRKLLATVLARLGQSGLPDTLHELRAAARNGTLLLDPETMAKLDGACADTAAIKSMIMRALRIKED